MADQEMRKKLLKKKLSDKEIKEEDVKVKLQVSKHGDIRSNLILCALWCLENQPAVGRLWADNWDCGHYFCGRGAQQRGTQGS